MWLPPPSRGHVTLTRRCRFDRRMLRQAAEGPTKAILEMDPEDSNDSWPLLVALDRRWAVAAAEAPLPHCPTAPQPHSPTAPLPHCPTKVSHHVTLVLRHPIAIPALTARPPDPPRPSCTELTRELQINQSSVAQLGEDLASAHGREAMLRSQLDDLIGSMRHSQQVGAAGGFGFGGADAATTRPSVRVCVATSSTPTRTARTLHLPAPHLLLEQPVLRAVQRADSGSDCKREPPARLPYRTPRPAPTFTPRRTSRVDRSIPLPTVTSP